MGASDTEAEVARLLDAGDLRGAATLIIEDHGPELLGYLRTVVRDRDVADDAFAQCCEDLWKGLSGFRRQASLRTWLYRVAWHAALRQLRDPHRRRRRTLGSTQLRGLIDRTRSRTPLHRRTEARDRLARLRAAMEPEEQALLTLRVDRKLSWGEVAAILSADGESLSEATVRKRFERLCLKLRSLVAEGGA